MLFATHLSPWKTTAARQEVASCFSETANGSASSIVMRWRSSGPAMTGDAARRQLRQLMRVSCPTTSGGESLVRRRPTARRLAKSAPNINFLRKQQLYLLQFRLFQGEGGAGRGGGGGAGGECGGGAGGGGADVGPVTGVGRVWRGWRGGWRRAG